MRKFIFVLAAILFLPLSSIAQTDIFITGGARKIPIAIPQACLAGGQTNADKDIPEVITRNLDLSGYFEVLNSNSFIERPGKCGGFEAVVFSDWRVIGADFIVKGTVTENDGRIQARLLLIDAIKQQMVLGKEYDGGSADIKKIGHKFANEILKYFTGEYGPFGTQIAFVTKIGRFKEIAVMDMDGTGIRQITNDQSLSMSPSWDPSGRSLVYTSFRKTIPDLFTVDTVTRAQRQITKDVAQEVSPIFYNDGKSFLVAKNEGGGSNLSVLGANGALLRRITHSAGAIDVSPSMSPDKTQIVFCSERAGTPQIYVSSIDGGGAKRISFTSSNYCTSPSWSPKGDKIAFVCRAEGGFNIFISGVDGSNALQLTSLGSNQDPDWSPDGRFIVFSSTMGRGGSAGIALMRADGTNVRQLSTSRGGDSQPAWGPRIE